MSALLMVALHFATPIVHVVPWPVNWLGFLMVVAGLAVANWHSRLFGRLGTNIDTFGEPGALTTEGLFRHTRNPMYLGMLTALVGLAIVLGSLAPVTVLLAFFLLLRLWYVPVEERAMAEKFGAEYAEYLSRVPRWL